MDNGELRQEIADIAKFWLDKGVGGFRLDAAKHVYNTERENVEFWTWFSDECKKLNPDVYLVAEVWDTDAAIMPYYTTGLSSMFNFSYSGATGNIAGAIRRGNGQALANQIAAFDKLIKAKDPSAINALFLSNHDNDRSSGYFGSDEAQMKMAAAIYILIPGNSFIYYGEEIAMTGRGKDENKRAPMVWAVADKTGQANGPAAMSERPDLAEGVTEQLAREDSLLNYYRKLIAAKNNHPAIARGIPAAIETDAKELCVYSVTYGEEMLLVAHNLSDEPVTGAVLSEVSEKMKLAETFCATDGSAGKNAFGWDGTALTLPGYGTAILAP
jgi:glycosidase